MARLTKRIESSDGKRRLDIMEVPQGLFRFTEQVWTPSADDVDRTFHGEGYRSLRPDSGLYQSEEAAEHDASGSLEWSRLMRTGEVE